MRVLSILALGWALWSGAALGQDTSGALELHPLAPPDTSSPRATLETFLGSLNKALELYTAGDFAFREYTGVAKRCLDVSEVPPNLVGSRTLDSALLLKEVLDRLELPPLSQVPGPEEVQDRGLTRWTVPQTEIDIALVLEGPRQGEFLFSPETVARSREYFERVRDLPYRPGMPGALYDQLRFGIQSRFLASIVAGLPQWTKEEYEGQLGWQWAVLIALVFLSLALVAGSIALGRRLSRSSRGVAAAIGPLLGPAMLISLQWIIPPLAPWPTELGGPGVLAIGLGFKVAALTGIAWLASVLIQKAGRLVIRLSGADQRPLHRQLIQVVARILALVVIAVVLFEGGQFLGIPLSALVTGLGVGGLAAALAAQSTLENLIGGINLFADRPVQIGDFCRFGQQLGFVEGIGLRSTRIRTLARTLVSIPNSSFAKMELENLSRRDRNLLRTTLRLAYGTSADQIETLLSALRELLSSDERVAPEPFRVRLLDLGRDALEIEVFVYVLTNDWNEYLGIREELLLRVMRTVDAAGLRLALPSERHEVIQRADPSPVGAGAPIARGDQRMGE